jgi:crossover junction endodeoxyribonuclease RuvC
MRVLGVDTALRCTGFGIIDFALTRPEVLECGVIKTTSKWPLSECLRRLAGGVKELVRIYQPDVAAIEGAFYHRNVKTAMVLGMARGVVVATLAELNIPVYEYAPKRAKQAVTGSGNASKEQIANVMSALFSVDLSNLPLDATDALALACCHHQTEASPLTKIKPL